MLAGHILGGFVLGISAGLLARWLAASRGSRSGWLSLTLGVLAVAAGVAIAALYSAIGGILWLWLLVLGADLAVVAAVVAVAGARR
jgi:hypothetical protein